jgi:hypothetical protein
MTRKEVKAAMSKLPPGTQVILQSWRNPDGRGRRYDLTVLP